MTEVNTFEFETPIGGETTHCVMELTEFSNGYWQEWMLPFMEIELLQGSCCRHKGRVRYDFVLSNEKAHILMTAVVRAVHQVNGQQN